MNNTNCLNEKNNYSKVKLAIGITSIIFALVIACCSTFLIGLHHTAECLAALFGTILTGTYIQPTYTNCDLVICFGILCAFFMLIAGVINIATRNSGKKGGSIAAIILYLFSILFSILFSLIFPNRCFMFTWNWLFIGFFFGAINGYMLYKKKMIFQNRKKLIRSIVGVVTVPIFITILKYIYFCIFL